MTSRLIVALDFPAADQALRFVDLLTPADCKLKVGFELFVSAGPVFVKSLTERGFDLFLDLKFHDIPNTVAAACTAAAELGVWMINVHAAGGAAMMQTARTALSAYTRPPKLIAVTVLTSMNQQQLSQTGIAAVTPGEQVLRLAGLAQESGLDGVVCSAQEAAVLRRSLGDDFLLVTPGIRPAGSEQGDQARIMTPEQAVAVGVDYLVVGRPITRAVDPLRVITQINQALAVN